MQLYKSIKDGLRIIKLNKSTIKRVSKERDLEDIFLSNLFLNYIIVMVIFMILLLDNNFLNNFNINKNLFYSILLVYPFLFNLFIFLINLSLALLAEMLYNIKKIRPLISVGFHISILYSIIFYLLFLISIINLKISFFLLLPLIAYFIMLNFVVLKYVYNLTEIEVTIVLLLFFLIISFVGIFYNLLKPLIIF